MRVAIAAEETLEPQHITVLRAANDHWSPGSGLEQPDAAQDERAHDALAELGLRNQQCAQTLGRDDQGLDRLPRTRIDQRRPSGELRELAHERARAMGDDRLAAAELAVLGDVD